jgi:ketosteroid isomerase-like protein
LPAVSRKNVELVMSLYDAVQRRDYESPFQACDNDILWDMSGFGLPDMAKVYRGHDGLREFWLAWLAAWETIEFKTLSAEEHGDHVIVEVEQRNRGRGSGVPVEFHYFQAFTVRNGKVTAVHMAETRAKALEVLGLREEEREDVRGGA